jgi:hypothetical protein
MMRCNPRARIVEMKGCGHAPPLMRSEQIGCVSEFLNEPEALSSSLC